MTGIPASVERDLYNAVDSAISLGVSVRDFKRLAMQMWDDKLIEKRKYDEQEWMAKI